MIKKFKNLSIWKKILIIVISLILISGIAFGVYMLLPKGNTFSEVKKLGDTVTGENLELNVTDIIITDKLNDKKAKDGYSFVCISYKYKNISQEAVEWENFPLLTLGIYDSDDTGKAPSEMFGNDEIDKDALREFSYIMGLDLNDAIKPIEKGKVRDDAEVFQVKKSDIENSKLYITFDIFDIGIKVEPGLSKLPNLKEVLKENKKKIKKKQEKQGIVDSDN